MIAEELDIERKCRDGQAERVYYELTEMCCVELERFNAKKAKDEVPIPTNWVEFSSLNNIRSFRKLIKLKKRQPKLSVVATLLLLLTKL